MTIRTALYRAPKISLRTPPMKNVVVLSVRLFPVIILGATIFACSASSGGFEAGAGSNSTNSVVPAADLTSTNCPMTNATQPCFCDSDEGQIPGRRVCRGASGWGECECGALSGSNTASDVSAKNKIPVSFVWQRTVPSGGSCKSGRYDGGFDGIYIPAITFGFGPIPVFGNVTFQLERSATGEHFLVKDGHMVGSALVAFPFEGDIIGTLDCQSRTFEGELKNCYYVIPGLPPFAFEGIIRAEYDKFNNTFVNGVWSVTELDVTGDFPDPLDVSPGAPVPFPPPLGGTGTWTNQWVL